MGRVLAASVAVLLLGISSFGLLGLTPAGGPVQMTIWEAYSRGHITITQVDMTYVIGGVPNTAPLGYEVRSTATVDVVLNEYVVLLSPNPRESRNPLQTTQDGVLTRTTVLPESAVTFAYGDFVAQGLLPSPAWWCTEARQFVQSGITVTLGGEILPFAMESMVQSAIPNPSGTQDDIWLHLFTDASPVVGKTVDGAFWKEIPETAGQGLNIVIRATNIAVKDDDDQISANPDAPNAHVWDVVPSGFVLDLSSVTAGYSLTANPDGSTTISWPANLPAADVTGQAPGGIPTPYVSRVFSYRVITPDLTPGRLNLPRAQVSVGSDDTAEAHSAQPVLDVLRVRQPPLADAGPGYEGTEGDTITFSAAASTDPNSDPLQFRWDFEADGTWDTGWSTDAESSFTYGDDFSGQVRVEVSDGELTDTAEAPVVIRTADPVIEEVGAEAIGNLTLRVAGEKWHDVTLELAQGGTTVTASVVRMPGSPDEQAATIEDVVIDLAQEMSITVYYTPMDDPVNGQPNGANPVWVIFDTGGEPVRLHHTFNVRHPDTWTWSLEDVLARFVGSAVTLSVTASDVGSDDLTFMVDWGDGSQSAETVFNDGIGADPFPSLEVNPIRATVTMRASYTASGTYTVTVTVVDDDGGSASATLTLSIG